MFVKCDFTNFGKGGPGVRCFFATIIMQSHVKRITVGPRGRSIICPYVCRSIVRRLTTGVFLVIF